jgi:hypothetical protein
VKENGPKRQETIRPNIKAKMKANKKKGRVIGIKMSVMKSEQHIPQHASLGKRSTLVVVQGFAGCGQLCYSAPILAANITKVIST